jgi:hypothetical protein
VVRIFISSWVQDRVDWEMNRVQIRVQARARLGKIGVGVGVRIIVPPMPTPGPGSKKSRNFTKKSKGQRDNSSPSPPIHPAVNAPWPMSTMELRLLFQSPLILYDSASTKWSL